MASKRGKRLGEMVRCPTCHFSVNPIVVEFVQGRQHHPQHGLSIPDRLVLECPKPCGSIFYRKVESGYRT